MIRAAFVGTLVGVAFEGRALDIAFLLIGALKFPSGEASPRRLASSFGAADRLILHWRSFLGMRHDSITRSPHNGSFAANAALRGRRLVQAEVRVALADTTRRMIWRIRGVGT
jgi:hypothetical protein